MSRNNLVFLEVIEWFDRTGREMVHRIPEEGSGEIKYGAQLIVRESQAAAFFYNGKACEAFGPGRHTLTTANIPVLTKIASLPWGLTSPLRAEVYFVNLKVFTGLKWGTRDPVAFKDKELGLIRLRAFGLFNVQVIQPLLFINRLVGTQGVYGTDEVAEYLGRVVVSRFNDYLGEHIDTIFSLPGRYEELSKGLCDRLRADFESYGIGLVALYIHSITPPPEVQKAIDDKSRLAVFDDLNRLLQLKASMAVEKAAESASPGAAGLALGLGLLVPGLLGVRRADSTAGAVSPEPILCPDCRAAVPPDARFCPHCGHQLLVFDRCAFCGKNLPPGARYCPRCGKPTQHEPTAKTCSRCGATNLTESVYCNQCGERL